MKGYLKNADAKTKAIDEYGWVDTGALGRINVATYDLILIGHAKGTMEDAISAGSGGLVEQLMLTEQNGRRLVAIVVLSLTKMANLGYWSQGETEILQKANEAVNDAKCDDCEIESKFLRKASEELRKNITLRTTLVSAI
jgi:long-subunit acyl-CoA synthetase (AMP-forming)